MRRKFTEETKEEVFIRDSTCQLCGSFMAGDIHHCYSGTHLPIGWKKGENINGSWNGILLCKDCHTAMHHTGDFFNGTSLKDNRILIETIAQKRYDRRNNIETTS